MRCTAANVVDEAAVAAEMAAPTSLSAGQVENRETISGARADRQELRAALSTLAPSDVLAVTRLHRLARSTRDLLDIVQTVDARGARLRSLADPWADTTTPGGRLILTVLGGIAEFERPRRSRQGSCWP